MENKRLESALAWCEKNNIESIRLNKFNRESKKKDRKFLTKRPGNRYKDKGLKFEVP